MGGRALGLGRGLGGAARSAQRPQPQDHGGVAVQAARTVRLADDHGKKPVYWFKEEPHPEVRSYIEGKGVEVRVGLPPPTQGKCSS
ncbi:restriction endonuclease fold toxin [Sorangium sp. So ce124]|uniref:restriction endonuclease fold toxin n=1 Tax=Sorangium sp. So ce124 TaxID=3133280 RepID=UPI003F6271BC